MIYSAAFHNGLSGTCALPRINGCLEIIGKERLVLSFWRVIVLFGLIQLIPVDKTNPKVVSEPNWAAAPGTRELAKAACFDCHSNETVWPWYARIAPSSWLLYRDVKEGRNRLNFSDWTNGGWETDEITEIISEGEMPPWYYTIMHPNAKLSDSEKQKLISGLEIILNQPATGG